MGKKQIQKTLPKTPVSRKIRKPSVRAEAALENIVFSQRARYFVKNQIGKTQAQLLQKWMKNKQASFGYLKNSAGNPFFHIEVNRPNGGSQAVYAVSVSPDLKSLVLQRRSHQGKTGASDVRADFFLRSVTLGNTPTVLRTMFPYTAPAFVEAVRHALLAADMDVRWAFGKPVLKLHKPV